MSLPEVGFCGLGAMGGAMAKHLVKSGFSVTGFDVFKPAVKSFVDAGGKAAISPVETAKLADVLVIMVTSAAQISSALFDGNGAAVRGLKKDAVIVVTSTVPVDYCGEVRRRLDDEVGRTDVFLLDCPVSGGVVRAGDGTLSIFSSGTEEGLVKGHAVLDAMSGVLYKIPGGVGFGSRAKICHQVMAVIEVALVNEAMALAARAGLNTKEVFDCLQKSDSWSWMNENRISHMLEGDTSIYSALPNSIKDSSIVVETARNALYPTPVSAAAQQVFLAAAHAGLIREDDSTVWRIYLPGYPDDAIHQLTRPENHAFVPTDRKGAVSTQDVIDAVAGSHLAASVEAMGFTEAVGLDTDVLYDIVSKGAGANTQFVNEVPKMKKPTWSLKDVPIAKDMEKRLVSVTQIKLLS